MFYSPWAYGVFSQHASLLSHSEWLHSIRSTNRLAFYISRLWQSCGKHTHFPLLRTAVSSRNHITTCIYRHTWYHKSQYTIWLLLLGRHLLLLQLPLPLYKHGWFSCPLSHCGGVCWPVPAIYTARIPLQTIHNVLVYYVAVLVCWICFSASVRKTLSSTAALLPFSDMSTRAEVSEHISLSAYIVDIIHIHNYDVYVYWAKGVYTHVHL